MLTVRKRRREEEERHIERSETYNHGEKQKDLRMSEKSREKSID